MRTIILAAGQGFQLDGMNKLLLRDPRGGERILDQYLRLFGQTDITVVVGYRAIDVMQRYPKLDYVYNADWKVTNNSYSLGLALSDEPCFVTSCDLLMDDETIKTLEEAGPNGILTDDTENRQLNSLNCSVADDSRIVELYQGAVRKKGDPEAIGVFKVTDKVLLAAWRRECMRHSNLFCGQNLLFDGCPLFSVDKGKSRFEEINTVADYMRILADVKGGA